MAGVDFPIEAGHIALFARSIGSERPEYHDREEPLAPPTFTMASAQFDPDFSLRPRPGQPWLGSGRTPSGAPPEGGGSGTLHGEQHFEYHRPIRAGLRLIGESRRGQEWDKQGRRGGSLHFHELVTEFRDAEGTLYVTSTAVLVRPSQAVQSP